jgi:cytoskeleton protein RodZ
MTHATPSDDDAASAIRVGQILAAERARLGISVQQAANTLRLRPSYLEAIEDGRLEDLPGATYAAGFVRAYAEFLGLDAAEIIRRFKSETETLTRRTTLSFPSPVSEGRVPSRFILTASAVVAIFIYAVWHFFASGERSVVDAVPPVPAQISQSPTEAPTQEAAPDPVERAAVVSGDEDVVNAAPAVEYGSSDTIHTVWVPRSEARAKKGSTPADEQAQASATTPPPANATSENPTGASKTPPQAVRPNAGGETGAGSAGAPATTGQDAQAAPRRPAAPSAGEGRIVVRASADSWIEIRDDDGAVLVRRMLRAGDQYRVPNRAGLNLMTGNAGGIEISVDGQAWRRMGPAGAAHGSMPLDPDQLRSEANGE